MAAGAYRPESTIGFAPRGKRRGRSRGRPPRGPALSGRAVNPSTAVAATVVDELIRCGLSEVVLAPGSRSAPLAIEFHRRAQGGDLRLSVRVDERSAAFCALGLAKASGSPAAVLCTSGTAAAHFHAAVIEADEAAGPLVVLTAHPPPHVPRTGAHPRYAPLR